MGSLTRGQLFGSSPFKPKRHTVCSNGPKVTQFMRKFTLQPRAAGFVGSKPNGSQFLLLGAKQVVILELGPERRPGRRGVGRRKLPPLRCSTTPDQRVGGLSEGLQQHIEERRLTMLTCRSCSLENPPSAFWPGDITNRKQNGGLSCTLCEPTPGPSVRLPYMRRRETKRSVLATGHQQQAPERRALMHHVRAHGTSRTPQETQAIH